jgi:N-acetylmuramoyl-L-alanine amidase
MRLKPSLTRPVALPHLPLLIGLLGVLLLALTIVSTITVTAATPVTGHRIVIDPGHGGSEPGSTECPDLPEKTANLDIAYRLKALLDQDGAFVFMTRTDDSYKSNNDRYTYANRVNGEVLVSVHLNGSTDHSVNGTLGLYGKRSKDEAFTRILHQRLASELGVLDRGVTNFASGVLLKSNMPATIQEAVFISNSQECARLKDGSGARQQQIAQSLYNGLVDWFSRP